MHDAEFTLDRVTVQFVTPGFKKVVDAIGIKKAAKLLDAMPGLSIYPACKRTTKASQQIADLIGEDAVLKLRSISRKLIYIPVKRAIAVKARHAAIATTYREGKSITEIAIDTGLCERQIYEIVRSGKKES